MYNYHASGEVVFPLLSASTVVEELTLWQTLPYRELSEWFTELTPWGIPLISMINEFVVSYWLATTGAQSQCVHKTDNFYHHLCAICLFTYRVVGIFVHLHYVNIQPYMFWQFFDQWNTKTCRILYTISSLSWSVMGTSKSRHETKQKPCSH